MCTWAVGQMQDCCLQYNCPSWCKLKDFISNKTLNFTGAIQWVLGRWSLGVNSHQSWTHTHILRAMEGLTVSSRFFITMLRSILPKHEQLLLLCGELSPSVEWIVDIWLKCWLSDSDVIVTKLKSILNSSWELFAHRSICMFHICMCNCEHLACGKPQQLERRTKSWHARACAVAIMEREVVRVLILHVTMRTNVFAGIVLLWKTEFAIWMNYQG